MKQAAKIMVADAEPFIRRSLAFALKKEGYGVRTVKDGQEAWQSLRNGFEPDILFLDVMTPEFSGLKLCKLIKEHSELKNVYVFWLTTRWRQSDKEQALSAGIDEYVTKPFSPSAIIKRVGEIIEERNGHSYG